MLEKVQNRVKTIGSSICLGLDPNFKLIKDTFGLSVLEFNKLCIDATYQKAACYKPQFAHYAAYGLEETLEKTINYIKSKSLDIPIILDAKRGDIGSTAEYYAKEAFCRYDVDAVTINPYLGIDAITPFMKYEKRSVIVLAKTSNPSAVLTQDLLVDEKPYYLHICKEIERELGHPSNLMYVVGATDLNALRLMRIEFPNAWFLVPGVGAQGGELIDSFKVSQRNSLFSMSRGIFGIESASISIEEYLDNVNLKLLKISNLIINS